MCRLITANAREEALDRHRGEHKRNRQTERIGAEQRARRATPPPCVAAYVRMLPRIGPMHGVHPAPNAIPTNNCPEVAERLVGDVDPALA